MTGVTALWLAFSAGLVSFLLPCTLPLLPGYLSYISGLGAEEVQARAYRGTVLSAALLFVLGFSLVFVALGATASYLGSLLLPHRDLLMRVAGIFIVIMAFFMLGLVQLPSLYRERRLHLARELGVWTAFPLGMAFAFGWSPCIGPVLTSILALATTQGTAQRGALLLLVYSAGLSVPFLLLAALAGRLFQSVQWMRRWSRSLNLGGGAVLLLMGVFLVLGRWTALMAPLMRWYLGLNLPF